MTEGFTLSIAMATGKLPLLLRANSALKEHLGNIAKQQFALWQPRLCPQGDGEAQHASLKRCRLRKTLANSGGWRRDLFTPSLKSNDRGLHPKHCHGNWQAPSASPSELCLQGTLGQHRQTTVRSLAAKTLPAR